MAAIDILLNNTKLHVIFGAIAAFVVFSWLVYQIVELRDQAGWRRAKALKDASAPRVKRAKRGGSTGMMTPLGAVLEVARENKKVENYDPLPAEEFASRVWEVSKLFNPQYQTEWVWGHDRHDLLDMCDFIDGLGCHEIAARLRNFEPYQTWAQSFFARDEDHPDNAPEVDHYIEQVEWLQETDAWQMVLEKANAQLLLVYQWDDNDEDQNERPEF